MRNYTADDVKKLTTEFVKLADPKKFSSRRSVMQEIVKRHSAEGDPYRDMGLDGLAYLFNLRVVKRLNANKSVPGAHPEFLGKWVEIMQPKTSSTSVPTSGDTPVTPSNGTSDNPPQLSSKLQKLVSDCLGWKQRAEIAEETVREMQAAMKRLEEEGVLTGV